MIADSNIFIYARCPEYALFARKIIDMQAYKTYARIEPTGRVVLSGLPFAEGSLVEVLVVNQSRTPAEREESWAALMQHVQALPPSQRLSDEDIATEIENYRNRR